MTIQEAIKSRKPLRRVGWFAYGIWRNNYLWSGEDVMSFPIIITSEDEIANDWEIKE